MSTYRILSLYERQPLRRRISGLVVALAVNLGLLLVLLGIGNFAPEPRKTLRSLTVDLLPESHSAEAPTKVEVAKRATQMQSSARQKPPIVIPTKPTIALPPAEKPLPILEMSKDEMAAANIGNLPQAAAGSGEGDSEVVGRGPHGEVLYAAEWARHPTDAELGGYLPPHPEDGFGVVACKTIPDDRVEDCVELDQTPGSHLASAVRQAAWQFRVRPPRRNGVPLVGSWVSIRIDYSFTTDAAL